MEEMITEQGIIPMNMGWRAGINTERPNTNIPAQTPYGMSFPSSDIPMPANVKREFGMVTDAPMYAFDSERVNTIQAPVIEEPKNIKPTPEFCQSFVAEIDTCVNDICSNYSSSEINSKVTYEIKSKIKDICHYYFSKYKQFNKEDLTNYLYNYCSSAFASFMSLDPNANTLTEIIKKDGKIYINPLIVYQYSQI